MSVSVYLFRESAQIIFNKKRLTAATNAKGCFPVYGLVQYRWLRTKCGLRLVEAQVDKHRRPSLCTMSPGIASLQQPLRLSPPRKGNNSRKGCPGDIKCNHCSTPFLPFVHTTQSVSSNFCCLHSGTKQFAIMTLFVRLSHSYSRCLPALGWISSLWHSEHWAEITLRQHRLRPSQCYVLIRQSDSPRSQQF